jgi:hypothetical protein
VPEKVEDDDPAQRNGSDLPQRLPDVGQSLFDAEGE